MNQASVFGALGGVRGRAPQRSLAVRIAAIVLLLDAFVATLAVLSVNGSREQYYARAEIISRNMSAIMAETVAGYFGRIDFALTVLAEQAGHEIAEGDSSRIEEMMRTAHERLPEVLTLGIAGADGKRRVVDSAVVGLADAELADRDYFVALRDNPRMGLAISQPLRGRLTQQWVIVLARRLPSADGSFAGIVYASLPVRRLTEIFAGLDVHQNDAIALRGPLPSLGVVARYPEAVGGVSAVGNLAVSQQLQDMTARFPEKGTYLARAAIDNVERVLSYHRVGPYPYYLLVGQSTEQMLDRWLWESAEVVVVALVFVIITTAGGIFTWLSLRARQALEGRLMLVEFAFNHQAEAVLLLGSQGQVVYGNTAAAQLFRRSRLEISAASAWDLGFGIQQGDWDEHWRQVAKGEPVTVTSEIVRPDGTAAPVVVSANYFSFGTDEFEVAIIRDIGEQVRYEKELRGALAVSQDLGAALVRKNEELARFADILAHHMQEPVRQQHIFAQHLARQLPKPLAPEVQMSLDAILDAARHHRDLLRDAQSYLAWQPPAAPVAPMSGDIALDLALARLEPNIARARAVIERQPLPALPIATAGLADVFTALVGNALTYHRPGEPPHISIGAQQQGDEVVVTVTDNGVGIPPEFRERVFGMFERLDPQPDQPGTGIGLALTKKMVEGAGGRIWIEQPEEAGTRVCFSLPHPGTCRPAAPAGPG